METAIDDVVVGNEAIEHFGNEPLTTMAQSTTLARSPQNAWIGDTHVVFHPKDEYRALQWLTEGGGAVDADDCPFEVLARLDLPRREAPSDHPLASLGQFRPGAEHLAASAPRKSLLSRVFFPRAGLGALGTRQTASAPPSSQACLAIRV
jgi:hypothetical protein